MLLFVGIAILALLPTILLHYFQHFRLDISCKKTIPLSLHPVASINEQSPSPRVSTKRLSPREMRRESRGISVTMQTPNNRRNRCCLHIALKSVDGQDFNFFPISFLFYMIFIWFLCLVIVGLQIINYYHYKHDIFTTDIIYHFPIESFHDHSIFELHTIDTSDGNQIYFYICDFITIYGVMILAIWESLFSFYRYYTTFVTTKAFKLITTASVICKFSIFGIIFAIVFVAEIHFYYWLFPIVILLYCGFNWYCTWKFASILIQRYKLFIKMEEKHQNNENKDILQSVYSMRRASLICCLLQSISLSAFVITYNIDIMYYLPVFWCLSCIVFALNFIRNRHYIKQSVFKIHRICYNRKITENDNKKTSSLVMVAHKSKSSVSAQEKDTENAEIDAGTEESRLTFKKNNTLNVNGRPLPKFGNFYSNPVIPKIKNPNFNIKSHSKHDPNIVIVLSSAKISDGRIYDNKNSSMSPTPSLQAPYVLNRSPRTPQNSHKHLPSMSPISKSAHCVSNSDNQVISINGQKTLRPSFRNTLKWNKNYLIKNSIHSMTGITGGQHEADDTEFDLCFDIEPSPSLDDDKSTNNLGPPPQLKHKKSNSMPVDIDDYLLENEKIDIAQILRSFNILSHYGFCAVPIKK